MENKSGKTDKKVKKTALQGSQKSIAKTKGEDDARKNSTENKLNNCKD